jgi:hypothetical protein
MPSLRQGSQREKFEMPARKLEPILKFLKLTKKIYDRYKLEKKM